MIASDGHSDLPGSVTRVSVVIRCCNEEKHIGHLLEGLIRQSWTDIEIIVVDSGSTDATMAIASRYPTKVLSIPKEEFSFGRSLNLGCSVATGDLIVAVSAHCYPVYPDWVERLIDPFEDPTVALAYGKQRGNGLTRFSEHRIFRQWFGESSDFAQRHPFANNANAAFRRAVWLKQPFDETLTGLEDLDWAHKAMRSGYRIAYVAEAEVIHVHEETWPQVYNRYRREAMAMRRIYPQEQFTLLDLIRLSIAGIAGDWRAAHGEGRLKQEFFGIFVFRLAQYLGTYHGYRQRDALTRDLRQAFYYPADRCHHPTYPDQQPLQEKDPISYGPKKPDGRLPPMSGQIRHHDISVSVTSAPIWPGEPMPEIKHLKSIEKGDSVTVSRLNMCVHTGTHIDAPAHFIQGGGTTSDIPLETLVGRAQVVELCGVERIGERELESAGFSGDCQRLLLKTSNSKLYGREFSRDYVALTPEGAMWLVEQGVAVIGIDYASIEVFGEKFNRTHKTLLEAGVVIIEGLNLGNVRPGLYELICLPLKLEGCDGAPARAILVERDSNG